jgi:rod shape-determining protein MreC
VYSASNRLILFGIAMFVCICLIAVSIAGVLAPAESALSLPLSLAQEGVSNVTRGITDLFNNIAELQGLRERTAELERQLVAQNEELVTLRERVADYQRLADLLNYIQQRPTDEAGLAASVIGFDTTGLLRTIRINRGTRDGVAVDMPVVTDLGLVGRVYEVGANTALVQLITDVNSFVFGRLQTTRALGVVNGTASGSLLMQLVPLEDEIKEGDTVVTSGVGGKFPRGLLVGQVTNQRFSDNQLFKEAQVRSLIDFSRLEIVYVITAFKPIEDTLGATPTPGPGNPAQ